jgi:hypothetical protein
MAPVPTIWDKLGLSKKAKEDCLRKLCETPLGQLLNNSTAPFQAISGGLLPPFCPVKPSLADLEKPGAEGAAAKIKADEANAKARAAAVAYLGTVDCHYWPEAADALVGALRGDRNECVRYAAALALANGCCCNKKTIEALNIVVSCSDRDGAPKENSQRVVAAAQAALDHCLACYNPPAPVVGPVKPPIEGTTPPVEGGGTQPNGDNDKDKDKVTTAQVVAGPGEAKQAIVPGELKPGTGPMPKATRPVGFEYYALIEQQPWEAIVAEGKRLSQLHRARTANAKEPTHTVAGVLSYATAGERTSPVDANGNWRAEVISPRPDNLWDMLHEPAKPPMATVVIRETVAPPTPKAVETREPAVVRREVAPPTAYNAIDMRNVPSALPTPAMKPVETPVVPAAKPPEVKAPVIFASTTVKSADAPPLPPPPVIMTRPQIQAPPTLQQPAQLPVILNGSTQTPIVMPNPMSIPAPTTASAPVPPSPPSAPAPAKLQVATPAPVTINIPQPAPKPVSVAAKAPDVPAAPKLVAPSTPTTAAPATKVDVAMTAPTPAPVALPVAPPKQTVVVSAPARAEMMPTPEAMQAIGVLAGNSTSQQRRQAAEGVMRTDLFSAPDLSKHLVVVAKSAKETSETRVACIRALVRGHANTPEVLKALEGLSDDEVPAVRVEAIIGLGRLKTGGATATTSPALR